MICVWREHCTVKFASCLVWYTYMPIVSGINACMCTNDTMYVCIYAYILTRHKFCDLFSYILHRYLDEGGRETLEAAGLEHANASEVPALHARWLCVCIYYIYVYMYIYIYCVSKCARCVFAAAMWTVGDPLHGEVSRALGSRFAAKTPHVHGMSASSACMRVFPWCRAMCTGTLQERVFTCRRSTYLFY
jgi:hypothetical protein